MSQSPTAADKSTASDYFRNWDALGLMIARGSSFSGRERNCVFLNTGQTRFADVSAAIGLDFLDDARAIAYTDWDHDGDLDLWVANRTAPRLRLLRNDLTDKRHSVSILLRGGQSNRNAIGARVELLVSRGQAKHRRIQSVTAGSGFLTQSSSWLHFGLGQGERIQTLRVRWPGQTEWESFSTAPSSSMVVLTKGTGTTEPYSINQKLAWKPQPIHLPTTSEQTRVVLSQRPVFPVLNFEDFEGSPQRIDPGAATGPILVNLWGSWCSPCLEELASWTQNREALQAANLRIVALSTDALGPGSREAALQTIDRLRFPHEHGMADAKLVQSLSKLRSRVLYRERPLPLPTSFLVDRQGRWAAYYTGTVSVEQLLKDVALLDAPQAERDSEAFPGEGRFVFRDAKLNPLAVADAYSEGLYFDDARRELLETLRKMREHTSSAEDSTAQLQVLQRLAGVESQAGREQVAIAVWQEAIELAGEKATPLRLRLAAEYVKQANRERAAEQLESIARSAPKDANVYLTVGMLWAELDESQRAIDNYRNGLRLDKQRAVIRFALATALSSDGQTDRAIRHYQYLARHDDSWAVRAANNLAWLRATHPNDQLRDGEEAVAMAQKACRLTEQQNPKYLGTLGSAYAEAGQFRLAIATTERAISLASDQNDLLDSLRARLELYQRKRPYRDTGE